MDDRSSPSRISFELPTVWAQEGEIRERLAGKKLAVFLDYDGTLTPIVADHRKALLVEEMRRAIAALAERAAVAIVSGRDLAMLRGLVRLDSVYLAGSHGFEIAGPSEDMEGLEVGTEFLTELDEVEQELRGRLASIHGHSVDRKRFSVAVHYRQVAEDEVGRLASIVEEVVSAHPRLARGGGKKVIEIQPRLDWNKGRAVLWLLERLGLDRADLVPIYIGDDLTDEHAFRALAGRGITIIVRDAEPRATAADYAVENTDEVRRLLKLLASVADPSGEAE